MAIDTTTEDAERSARIRLLSSLGWDAIDPDLPIFMYGLVSVQASALLATIEEMLGVAPPDDLLMAHPSISALARFLAERSLVPGITHYAVSISERHLPILGWQGEVQIDAGKKDAAAANRQSDSGLASGLSPCAPSQRVVGLEVHAQAQRDISAMVKAYVDEEVSVDAPLMDAGLDSYLLQNFMQVVASSPSPLFSHCRCSNTASPSQRPPPTLLLPFDVLFVVQELNQWANLNLPQTTLLEHGTIRQLAVLLCDASAPSSSIDEVHSNTPKTHTHQRS